MLEGCRFNHEVPKNEGETVSKAQALRRLDMYVTQSEWRHLNEVNHEQFVTDNNLVLLDSGSNEMVRPFNSWEWQQIVDKKPYTKRIWVGLALNQCTEAGITMGGELMRAPPKYGPQKPQSGGWICPITRIRTELGMDFLWTARGPVIDGGMLKQPIVGIVINGLPYCTWEQFQGIRWALQQSHQMGRKAAIIHCGMHGEEVAAQNWTNATTQNQETTDDRKAKTQQVRSNSWGNRKVPAKRTNKRTNSPTWGSQ